MPLPTSIPSLTTPGGLLLMFAVLIPFLGVLAGLVMGAHRARLVAFVTLALGSGISLAIAWTLLQSGVTVVYLPGGWAPALGIALRADGLSVVFIACDGRRPGSDFVEPQEVGSVVPVGGGV